MKFGSCLVLILKEYIMSTTNNLEDEEYPPEPGVCPNCSGSGEGRYEGTRCSSCKGTGESVGDSDDFDEPEEEYDSI